MCARVCDVCFFCLLRLAFKSRLWCSSDLLCRLFCCVLQGHLLSTACMHAPAVVPPGKEGEFGPVTGLCITAGCLAGSGALWFIMTYLQMGS
jgi:hypothetical protein